MSRRERQPADALPLDAIRIGKRYRQHMGDLDALATSIAEHGLLHPVVVTSDGRLIAGQRRLAAVRLLGWETVPVTVLDPAALLRAELEENTVRQDFLPSEIDAIYRATAPAVATPRGNPSGRSTGAHFPITRAPRTRDKVAAYVGLSGRTLEKIAAVVDSGDEAAVATMDATGNVAAAYRAMQMRVVAKRIAAEPLPLPAGPFRVIVADPPWPYGVRAEDGTHRARNPYPTMTLAEIATLPVAGLAHDDAVLWLWTTNAFLEAAFGIVRAWGFETKTVLTWAKNKIGTGDWLRGQTEHCLMAVRGRPLVTLRAQTTLLHGPVREHSRKPDEFYAMVESLCPGSKVELFAREARPDWSAWGAEAPEAKA